MIAPAFTELTRGGGVRRSDVDHGLARSRTRRDREALTLELAERQRQTSRLAANAGQSSP